MYQAEQNTTQQTDAMQKGMNKKLIAEIDSLGDEFLSCPL